MILRRPSLILLTSLSVFSGAVSASETRFLSKFERWTAYQYEADCWISSKPSVLKADHVSSMLRDTDFQMMIALKYGSNFPNLQIWLNDSFNVELEASAAINGQKYDLFFADEALWFELDDEWTAIKQALAGNEIEIKVQAIGADVIEAIYKTDKVQEAYNYLARNCER
jgi:hypothetical protein